MLVNAALWCVGLENQIGERTNVDIVGEYQPIKFGFNSFNKGRKPSDYAK
jgi:hypothetical protein